MANISVVQACANTLYRALSETHKATTQKKGIANGFAELDANGHVPASQLPSFVDDVIEVTINQAANVTELGNTWFVGSGTTTVVSPEAGKMYVLVSNNTTWRWSGTQYVQIASTLALGTTSATAFRGDHGNAAYLHSQNRSNPHGITKAQVGLSNVPNLATNDTMPTYTVAASEAQLVSGEKLSIAFGKLAKFVASNVGVGAALNAHMQDNTPPKHITEAERTAWNAKSTFSGAYADLTGKPSIPVVETATAQSMNAARSGELFALRATVSSMYMHLDNVGTIAQGLGDVDSSTLDAALNTAVNNFYT